MVAHLGDWAEPGYPVDPWLEVQLAIAGVPGAQGDEGTDERPCAARSRWYG